MEELHANGIENTRAEITGALVSIDAGDRSAVDRLLPLVYEELRSLASRFMRREDADHSLEPTEVVNEAYLRLVNIERVKWQGKTHFLAVGARAMRRILVDHARRKLSKKRGERPQRVELTEELQITAERDTDVLALEDALERLEMLDPRQARIVELRFYGGLTVLEVAEVMDLSKRTVGREWGMVRAWLRRELGQ